MALAIFEGITVTRPYPTPFVTRLLNPFFAHILHQPRYLPFQQLVFARKILITLTLALNQLGPLLAGAEIGAAPPKPPTEIEQLDRLDRMARSIEAETTNVMALDMLPFVADEAGANDLNARIKEHLVNHAVRADPEVRNAVGEVMKRRRVGAPAGAKGTK